MRPLTLKMAGLRSYRMEQTIDFSDAGLMAIVGDTGAGKSSILEAIFFALYGGCTWDRRAVVPLISDGATAMQVELTFVAEGRRWKVFRSTSRTGAGSRHELTCLDDPSIRVDNADPVTAEVRRLVGLDDEAFLRTVILPQGRFQALLQASRADRTAILKGIFRLEQLAVVREAADAAARRLRPGIDELRSERLRMLDDPAAVLGEAETRQEVAKGQETRFKALRAHLSGVEKEKAAARETGTTLRHLVEQVRKLHLPEAPEQLAVLAETAEAINRHREELDEHRRDLQQDVDELQSMLDTADAAGVGVAGLASAASTLQSLATQLPGLLHDHQACEQEAQEVERLIAKLKDDQATAIELNQRADEAKRNAESALHDTRTASETLQEGRRRLLAARDAAQTAAATATQAQGDASAVEPAREAAVAARQELTEAEAEHDEAAAELASVQRANAAAHAAEGSLPGEPCPICRRELPAEFVAPRAPGDAEARTRLAVAKTTLKLAQKRLSDEKARLAAVEETARQAARRSAEAQSAVTNAVVFLRELVPDVSLEQDDELLLSDLSGTATLAEAKQSAAAGKEEDLGRELAAATSKLQSDEGEIQRRNVTLARNRGRINQRYQACERAAADLPLDCRPSLPLESTILTTLAGQVRQRQLELTEVETKLTAARRNLRQANDEHARLTLQLHEEVAAPARQLELGLGALAQRVGDLMVDLRTGNVPQRFGESVAALGTWGAALIDAVDASLAASDSTLLDLQRQTDELERQIGNALAGHGFADHDQLEDAVIRTAADLARAVEDAAVAREQIPLAAALDTSIARAGGLLEALDELSRLMSDGKFIGYVVARKQQTLLAVASEIFSSMTGARYGFSDSFEVIDRLTGLPRGVKTLSGGETFMASLALALGLVELAGRSGGRLDALFLDEGFGSLDANSLSEALDALTRQAESGRLVVLISHLRTVAEAMEQIVAITRGPQGSRVHPLTATALDQLVTEEIEAGLLS